MRFLHSAAFPPAYRTKHPGASREKQEASSRCQQSNQRKFLFFISFGGLRGKEGGYTLLSTPWLLSGPHPVPHASYDSWAGTRHIPAGRQIRQAKPAAVVI